MLFKRYVPPPVRPPEMRDLWITVWDPFYYRNIPGAMYESHRHLFLVKRTEGGGYDTSNISHWFSPDVLIFLRIPQTRDDLWDVPKDLRDWIINYLLPEYRFNDLQEKLLSDDPKMTEAYWRCVLVFRNK